MSGDTHARPLFAASAPQEPDRGDRGLELLRNRLRTLAGDLLLSAGKHGVTTGDLRFAAENRGWLTGSESLAFMNALQLRVLIREAGGFATKEMRRSKVKSAKRSPNVVYVTREFAEAVA